MAYDVVIRDNRTGEAVTKRMDLDWNGNATLWWWTEGNFGCDCNRGFQFALAKEVSDKEFWERDRPCGRERYSVIEAVLADGSRIKIDDDRESV
jgi:hypothetical protein